MVDLTVTPVDGRHPQYRHLVYFEAEQHCGMLLVTNQLAEGSALVSWEDWQIMAGETADFEFCYACDEYLSLFEKI
jgi:hypothetical protein